MVRAPRSHRGGYRSESYTVHMKNKAFTMIELLVVIAVIGLLSSIVIVNLQGARAKARDAQRQRDIAQIEKALLLYWEKYGQFPSETSCDSSIGSCGGPCSTCGATDWAPTSGIWQGLTVDRFMGILPKDPTNNSTYHYEYEPCCNQDCGGGRTCTGKCCEYDLRATQLETTGSPYVKTGRWE